MVLPHAVPATGLVDICDFVDQAAVVGALDEGSRLSSTWCWTPLRHIGIRTLRISASPNLYTYALSPRLYDYNEKRRKLEGAYWWSSTQAEPFERYGIHNRVEESRRETASRRSLRHLHFNSAAG